MSNVYRRLMQVAALSATLALGQIASASTYLRGLQGTIDSIDFVKHTISVNHHTYLVSPSATYSGVPGFGVLSTGMNIQYFVQGTPGSSSETITRITVRQ